MKKTLLILLGVVLALMAVAVMGNVQGDGRTYFTLKQGSINEIGHGYGKAGTGTPYNYDGTGFFRIEIPAGSITDSSYTNDGVWWELGGLTPGLGTIIDILPGDGIDTDSDPDTPTLSVNVSDLVGDGIVSDGNNNFQVSISTGMPVIGTGTTGDPIDISTAIAGNGLSMTTNYIDFNQGVGLQIDIFDTVNVGWGDGAGHVLSFASSTLANDLTYTWPDASAGYFYTDASGNVTVAAATGGLSAVSTGVGLDGDGTAIDPLYVLIASSAGLEFDGYQLSVTPFEIDVTQLYNYQPWLTAVVATGPITGTGTALDPLDIVADGINNTHIDWGTPGPVLSNILSVYAGDVPLITGAFNGVLSVTEDDVQKALDVIDDLDYTDWGLTPPGGSDTHVQYNDGSAFGGEAGLKYLEASDQLIIGNPVSIATATNLDVNGAAAINQSVYVGDYLTVGFDSIVNAYNDGIVRIYDNNGDYVNQTVGDTAAACTLDYSLISGWTGGYLVSLTSVSAGVWDFTKVNPATIPGTYTDEKARDALSTALTEGVGIDITVNDGADTITIASTITQYTDELAEDAALGNIVIGAGLTGAYDDGGNHYDIASSITQYTDALAKAAVIQTKSINIESPSSSEDLTLFYADDAITIGQMASVLIGSSTPTVAYTIRFNADRSAAGTEVVTAGTTVTSTTTGSIVTAFNDATIPADSWVWLETTAQSGTVGSFALTIKYTLD